MVSEFRFQLLFAAAALLLGTQFVQGATIEDLQGKDLNQVNRAYKAAKARLGSAATPTQLHAQMLRSEAGWGLLRESNSKDRAGHHYRYQQTYRGLPIYGETIVVSESLVGNIRAMFGNKVSNLSADLPTISIKLSPIQALSIAKRAGMGKAKAALKTEDESVQRLIYIDDDKRAYVAYVVSYSAEVPEEGLIAPRVLVDANSGRVISQWSDLTE